MTTQRDPDRLLAAYLADGMEVLSDRVVDAVLDEVHRTRQRTVFGPRRTPIMSNFIKVALASATAVAVAVAGISFLSRDDGAGAPGPAPSPIVSSSPIASPSPAASPSPGAVRMTVAGSIEGGAKLEASVRLLDGWQHDGLVARRGGGPPDEPAFFMSIVDNTFSDPCGHVQRDPKVGATVEAVATALGEIPNTTAPEPVQTTLAGRPATYLELTLSPSLPCSPDQFYWWQDSPNNYWWALATDEVMRVWIVDVGGQPVAIAARTYPDIGDAASAELEAILDSIVFDTPPPS